jgi:hypothetical protein
MCARGEKYRRYQVGTTYLLGKGDCTVGGARRYQPRSRSPTALVQPEPHHTQQADTGAMCTGSWARDSRGVRPLEHMSIQAALRCVMLCR